MRSFGNALSTFLLVFQNEIECVSKVWERGKKERFKEVRAEITWVTGAHFKSVRKRTFHVFVCVWAYTMISLKIRFSKKKTKNLTIKRM